jgi:hypothetical protein
MSALGLQGVAVRAEGIHLSWIIGTIFRWVVDVIDIHDRLVYVG